MRYTTANKQLSDKLECWINIRCDVVTVVTLESAGETNELIASSTQRNL